MLLFVLAVGLAFLLRHFRAEKERVRLRVRLVALPIVGALAQISLGTPPLRHLDSTARFVVVLCSYTLVGIWLVVNVVRQTQPLRRAGWFVMAGFLTNFAAIAANRGMPVSRWALAVVGDRHPTEADGNLFKHVLANGHNTLGFLGDVIPINVPGIRNVISVGDILIFIGVILVVACVDFSTRASARAKSEELIVDSGSLAKGNAPSTL